MPRPTNTGWLRDAKDLLSAAKFAAKVLKANGLDGVPIELSERVALQKLEQAIAKAEGK